MNAILVVIFLLNWSYVVLYKIKLKSNSVLFTDVKAFNQNLSLKKTNN